MLQKSLDVAKLRFRRSQLLEKLRIGFVHLLLTSDRSDADAYTEAICDGLVLIALQQKAKAKGTK